MAYKLTQNGVKRLADGAFIPSDETNADYVVYLKWVAEGNAPQTADPIPAPVKVVTIDEVLELLKQKGVLAQADIDELKKVK